MRIFLQPSMVKYLFLLSLFFWSEELRSQITQDSIPPVDTVQRSRAPIIPRRIQRKPVYDSVSLDTLLSNKKIGYTTALNPINFNDSFKYLKHPFFKFTDPIRYRSTVRQWEGKEAIFYSIIG